MLRVTHDDLPCRSVRRTALDCRSSGSVDGVLRQLRQADPESDYANLSTATKMILVAPQARGGRSLTPVPPPTLGV